MMKYRMLKWALLVYAFIVRKGSSALKIIICKLAGKSPLGRLYVDGKY